MKLCAKQVINHNHVINTNKFNWIDIALKGVPEGVVNFVPADGPVFGDTITKSPYLAGINFTGSVP